MNEQPNALQNVTGDGSPSKVEADELGQIREEMRRLATDGQILQSQRISDGGTRFCFWDGMSDDGLKHEADMGKKAFPYEGAPDVRFRLVDKTVRKLSARVVQAAKRATLDFEVEGPEEEGLTPEKASAIWQWIRKQWGRQYHKEIRKGASYFFDDTPAGVVWYVGWRREQALRMSRVTLDEVGDWFLDNYTTAGQAEGEDADDAEGHPEPHDPAEAELIRSYFLDPALEDTAVDLLAAVMPSTVTAQALRKMVRKLRSDGEAEFPEVYVCHNQPVLWALRLFEDVFVPVNTVRDIQNARVVYIREWLTAAQVHEYALREGWDSNFVDKLLGRPDEQNATVGGGAAGQSGLPVTWGTVQQAQTPLSMTMGLYKDYRHLYEVCRAYTRSVNDDGIPGIFVTTFSHFVDQAAKPRELVTSGHGKMPFVYEQREAVNNMLTDSRSVSFVSQSTQRLLKMYVDSKGARAQLNELPPLEAGMSVAEDTVSLSPLAINKRARKGDLDFMAMPATRDATDMIGLLTQDHRDYWGLAGDGVDPTEAGLMVQEDVDVFLGGLEDAIVMVMQDAQMFLTPEQIEKITGRDGRAIGRDLEDIQGQFKLTMEMDTLDFNVEFLTKFSEMIFKYVLPLDTGQTIDRSKAVHYLFNKINPSMARKVVIPAEAASQREIDDEDAALVKALNGVEAPMMAEGQNHRVRLERLQMQLQKPSIQQRVMADPAVTDILERRVKNHQHQLEQEDNKVIGRIGAVPEEMAKRL